MVMRITGLSSGMDIDKMVSDLMKVEKVPQDKLRQKKELLSFQTILYREINTKMAALRDALNNVRYSSNVTGFKAAASSNEVSVVANSATSASSHTIQVNELATNSKLTGSAGVTNFGLVGTAYSSQTIDTTNNKIVLTVDNSAKVITLTPKAGGYTVDEMKDELQKQIDSTFGKNMVTVGVNGGALELSPVAKSGFTPQVIVSGTNTSVLGFTNGQSYRFSVGQTIGDLATSNKLTGSGSLATSGQFQITGSGGTATIDYVPTDSIQTIMNKVNASAAEVTMTYDSVNDQFVMKSKKTGVATGISVQDVTGNLMSTFKMETATAAVGKDASYILDNGSVQTSATNSISTGDGTTITFNNTTTSPITITVASDPSAVIDKIKKFVTAYNDMIDLVNTRLSEQKEKGYQPLSDEQKDAMNDEDIANWNKKVQQGLLSNSPILKKIKSSLREVFSDTVSGLDPAFSTLSSVGITTVPYVTGVPQNAGKLQIDEDKLRDAILQNPDAVNKLFTNNPGYESQQGVAVKLYNRVDSLLGNLIDQAGRTGGKDDDITTVIGSQINKLNLKITDFTALLNKKEDNYYRRFTAMEQAIEKGNAQMAWLSQQLG
ncbi:flagellar hook-associated protein 2 [Paenibacillus sp. CCS19]|uniref:flagellar filament capping protein FliD n=1 Tax=Paenibacillus sp. CCS19 TaxID=3158387 RepID=UPI002569A932|nr:flagellar filament capping protein FliD [Paenibacillus cellulosilyticus]GMK38267.1 flagellar hook-associated protein 2 [Paenibacillus cellulosilyticus]